MPRIDQLLMPWLVAAALSAVACCPADTTRTVIRRDEDHRDASCEEVCMQAIASNEEELLGCTPGRTEDGDEAAVCLWEAKRCDERNQCC